jgi:indole-3-glycerol phosphate synthase
MSIPKHLQERGEILDEIMRYHREQLPKIMREVPIEQLRALASVVPPANDFYAALTKPGVSLIAECKKASPSKGLIAKNYDAVALAQEYALGGASAISILTDARHFQGSLEDLRNVRERLPKMPLLRKDFIFHPYQVYEARAAGADAILLIASVLGDHDLRELLTLSQQMGMGVLVEVHTEAELARMLNLKPQPNIIGINNRNLQTFAVDFANTARLRQHIPSEIAVVAESGLRTTGDVQEMRRIGVDAMLVGETLVRSKDRLRLVQNFVAAGRGRFAV